MFTFRENLDKVDHPEFLAKKESVPNIVLSMVEYFSKMELVDNFICFDDMSKTNKKHITR